MVKQKKLLLRCSDDSVMIMSFILDDNHGFSREGTKEEIEAEITKSSTSFNPERLPILSWEEITEEDMPERTYRDAWVTDGKKIDHDIVKARDIHRDYLRVARSPLLLPLDNEYRAADENNDLAKKEEVRVKKQVLRDVTKHPDIEKAKTVEELASLDILTLIKDK